MTNRRAFPMEKASRTAAAIAVSVLIGMLPSAAPAAPPPTGTISCDVAAPGSQLKPTGFAFKPVINATPRDLLVKAQNITSTCDPSNVVGGKAPIVGVHIKFSGHLRDATCASFISNPGFEKGKVQLKWLGLNPSGHTMTVAVNNLKILSSGYDTGTDAVILATETIVKGAFVGKTVTLHLGLDAPDDFAACSPGSGYIAMPFGEINPSTVVVQ